MTSNFMPRDEMVSKIDDSKLDVSIENFKVIAVNVKLSASHEKLSLSPITFSEQCLSESRCP